MSYFLINPQHNKISANHPHWRETHRQVVDAHVEHYNYDRPHQGVGNVAFDPSFEPTEPDGKAVCDEQLGGWIRSYRRNAA